MQPNDPYRQPHVPAPGPYGPAPAQPQQNYDTLPAPNYSGRPGGHNPYEFIVNANTPQLGAVATVKNDNFLKKMIAVILGVILLFVIGGTLATKLIPSSDIAPQLINLVQEQQEIIRVAKLGTDNANELSVRSLAFNAQLGVTSSQSDLMTYMGSIGTKVGKKQLGLKQDSKTDELLTNAKATSTYDSAFSGVMKTQLTAYQADVQAAYKAATGKKAKEVLAKNYDAATLLLQQAKTANGDSSAATTTSTTSP